MRISAVLASAVLLAAVSACSASGTSGGVAGDDGQAVPSCYSAVTSPQGQAVTVAVLGSVNCTSVTQFLRDQFPTYRVTANAPEGPGNAVCQGMLGGAYPATVIDPTGNAEDTECLYLGFSPAP
jgi:hypothetical protein